MTVSPVPIVIPYTVIPCHPTSAFPDQKIVSRPQVPTFLECGGKRLEIFFPSVIDSGADYCMFPAQFGEMIGIPIREGKEQATRGIGHDTAYFHFVKVFAVVGKTRYYFNCYAGFMYSLDAIGMGLLGRHGFFELFEAVTFKQNLQIVELVPKSRPTAKD